MVCQKAHRPAFLLLILYWWENLVWKGNYVFIEEVQPWTAALEVRGRTPRILNWVVSIHQAVFRSRHLRRLRDAVPLHRRHLHLMPIQMPLLTCSTYSRGCRQPLWYHPDLQLHFQDLRVRVLLLLKGALVLSHLQQVGLIILIIEYRNMMWFVVLLLPLLNRNWCISSSYKSDHFFWYFQGRQLVLVGSRWSCRTGPKSSSS